MKTNEMSGQMKNHAHRRFWPLICAAVMLICSPLAFAGEEAKPGANVLANPAFALGRQFWELGKGGKTVATLDINGDDTPGGAQRRG